MKNNLRIGFCMLENSQKDILYNIVHVVIKLIFQDASDGHVGFIQIIQVARTCFSDNLP